jgi:hypothetical protein
MAWIRLPTQRAGSTNSGKRTSASSVICQLRKNIASSVTITVMALPTTDERVFVNALWASRTSLLRRLTSAPVWVRVKKATGMRWKWAKTCVRMSKMSPSPTRAEIHRSTSERAASKTASTPRSSASSTTRSELPGRMPWSMIAA